MMGVLCAYLLMMSVFAYTYAVIGEFGSEPFFNQGEQWNQIGRLPLLQPDHDHDGRHRRPHPGGRDLGRSLTAAEALIGQIYMVTVVAVIVTNLGRTRVIPEAVEAPEVPPPLRRSRRSDEPAKREARRWMTYCSAFRWSWCCRSSPGWPVHGSAYRRSSRCWSSASSPESRSPD